MDNRNIDQQIKISEAKLDQKKQQFLDVQNMDFNLIKQYLQPQNPHPQPSDVLYDIQKYKQVRSASTLIEFQQIQPSNYKGSLLTPQQCRKFHDRLKERKGLYAQQMKQVDGNDLNSTYWKTYREFMQRSNENNQNIPKISNGIADIKNCIQILSKPPNLQQLQLCTKQYLEQDTIKDLQVKYSALEKRIKENEFHNDIDIEGIMERARKYFGEQS